MGQKIHPTGFRLAVTRDWSSRWYANSKNFAGMLNEDVKVRDFLKAKLMTSNKLTPEKLVPWPPDKGAEKVRGNILG